MAGYWGSLERTTNPFICKKTPIETQKALKKKRKKRRRLRYSLV